MPIDRVPRSFVATTTQSARLAATSTLSRRALSLNGVTPGPAPRALPTATAMAAVLAVLTRVADVGPGLAGCGDRLAARLWSLNWPRDCEGRRKGEPHEESKCDLHATTLGDSVENVKAANKETPSLGRGLYLSDLLGRLLRLFWPEVDLHHRGSCAISLSTALVTRAPRRLCRGARPRRRSNSALERGSRWNLGLYWLWRWVWRWRTRARRRHLASFFSSHGCSFTCRALDRFLPIHTAC